MCVKEAGNCKKCRLGIERVENCFHEQNVHSACHKVFDLLGVCSRDLLEVHFAFSGVIDISRDRQCAIKWANRTRNEYAPLCEGIRCFPRNFGCGEIQLRNNVLEPIICLRDCRRVKGVRLDDVGACHDVFAVNLANDFWLR